MCVCPPHQNFSFVQLELHRESSHRRGHMAFSSLFVAESAPLSGRLDSLSAPLLCRCCSTFLSEQLSQDVAEMLLVVRREVEEDMSWLNSDDAKK